MHVGKTNHNFYSTQCPIRWVGADRQAQQESYTEIHQYYPINRANSDNIYNNEAR